MFHSPRSEKRKSDVKQREIVRANEEGREWEVRGEFAPFRAILRLMKTVYEIGTDGR